MLSYYRVHRTCTKVYSWNSGTCIFENNKYLKSIADNPVIVCDEIRKTADSVFTNVTNTLYQQILQVLRQ